MGASTSWNPKGLSRPVMGLLCFTCVFVIYILLYFIVYFIQLYVYICLFIHSFIHLVVCLTTGPKPLSKRALHIVQSRVSSFRCEYPLFSLMSSSSFLRLLPRLPVNSIPPFIFPLITCRIRQFPRILCLDWSPFAHFTYVFVFGVK
jgi:hypothetical protein